MKRSIIIYASALFLLLAQACSDGITNTQQSDEYVHSASNVNIESITPSDAGLDAGAEDLVLASSGSITYSYDPSTQSLYLQHEDAIFRSSPESISVRIERAENIITVVEEQQAVGDGFLRRYDLGMRISDLPAGVYRVLIVEPYAQTDQLPLTFKLDLVAALSGSFDRPLSASAQESLSR